MKPLIVVPHTLSELTGPVYGHNAIEDGDNDLTKMHKGEPLGERIIVHGQILDEDRRPVLECAGLTLNVRLICRPFRFIE